MFHADGIIDTLGPQVLPPTQVRLITCSLVVKALGLGIKLQVPLYN